MLGAVPAKSTLRWSVSAQGADRARLAVQRAVLAPFELLHLRGGARAATLVGRFVGPYQRPLVARAAPNIAVSFMGFDRYWTRVFLRGDSYEPELESLFRRLQHPAGWDFLDGGANIGLWSAVLTSPAFGMRRAVAVEASRSTFERLAATTALCDGRFTAVHAALGAADGVGWFEEDLPIASRHLVADQSSPTSVAVAMTSIDSLVAKHGLHPSNLLIKLDVEGAEIACIDGAATSFGAGAVVLYEDHGKDPTSAVTRELLARGAACWFIHDDGSLERILDAADVARHKIEPNRGYNFVAVAGEYDRTSPTERRLFG